MTEPASHRRPDLARVSVAGGVERVAASARFRGCSLRVMLGKRVVAAPDGERWQVGRRWLGKPPPKPWSRRRRRERIDAGDPSNWLDAVSFIDLDAGSDFLAGIAAAVLVAAVFALLVLAVLPLLGLAFEFALLIGLLASGVFGHVVLRRPWTIEAVSADDPKRRVCFAVKGWRRSRRAIGALVEAIATTGLPSAVPEAMSVGPGGGA